MVNGKVYPAVNVDQEFSCVVNTHTELAIFWSVEDLAYYCLQVWLLYPLKYPEMNITLFCNARVCKTVCTIKVECMKYLLTNNFVFTFCDSIVTWRYKYEKFVTIFYKHGALMMLSTKFLILYLKHFFKTEKRIFKLIHLVCISPKKQLIT